jgi:hypothetical protein
MPGLTTFNIATKKGPAPVKGVVMWLLVDGKRHKFVFYDNGLTEFRSGWKVGDCSWTAALAYASNPYRRRLNPRQIGQQLLDKLVAMHGAERVWATFADKPTINP